MTMPGFSAECSLYRSAERYVAKLPSGSLAGKSVTPSGLFRYCDGWPPICCTCDLENGGCDCSRTHTEM